MATAVVLLAAACSDAPTTADESAAVATRETSTTSTLPDLTDVVHPPAIGEFDGALTDVSDHACDRTVDGWRVVGTVTNPTSAAVDYRIYISLLNGALVTRALVEVEIIGVPAGGSANFDELIELPDQDLRCVLRVERRPAGSS